jgi:capsid protein
MQANVNMDADQFFVAMTAQQFDDLLAEVQTTSLDYNTKPVLVDGRISNFMGFTFVHTELLAKASTTRSCIAWAKSGIHLGLWKDVSSSIDKRPDKSNSMQVYSTGTFGATRLEQGRVVEIQCTET